VRAAVRTAMRTAVRATMRAMPGRRSFQLIAISVIISDTFFRTPGYFISVFVIEFGMIFHFVALLPGFFSFDIVFFRKIPAYGFTILSFP
jgi:hypothetical protein